MEWHVNSWDWVRPSTGRLVWRVFLFGTPLWSSGSSGHSPSARSGKGSTTTKTHNHYSSSWSSKLDLRCTITLSFVGIHQDHRFRCRISSCSISVCMLVLINRFPFIFKYVKLISHFFLPLNFIIILRLFFIILL